MASNKDKVVEIGSCNEVAATLKLSWSQRLRAQRVRGSIAFSRRFTRPSSMPLPRSAATARPKLEVHTPADYGFEDPPTKDVPNRGVPG